MSASPEEPVNAAEQDPTVDPDAEVGSSPEHGIASASDTATAEQHEGEPAPHEERGTADDEAEVGLGPAD
jgi:hypothetical protein